MSQALYLDHLEVGMRRESARRTIAEAHVSGVAGVSGDFNRLHTDQLSAARTSAYVTGQFVPACGGRGLAP